MHDCLHLFSYKFKLLKYMNMRMNCKIVNSALTIGSLLFCNIALADTVYFKNGFRHEGEVKETSEGAWVDGGFFKKDEIERIEKSPVKVEKQKSWIDNVLSSFGGLKEKDKIQSQTAQPSSGVSAATSAHLTEPQQGVLEQGVGAYQGYMATQVGVLQQAQQLKMQADQQQMMREREIRAMEENDDVGMGQASAPKENNSPVTQYRQNVYHSTSGSYQRTQNQGNPSSETQYDEYNRNPLKKGIKIDTEGNVKWE